MAQKGNFFSLRSLRVGSLSEGYEDLPPSIGFASNKWPYHPNTGELGLDADSSQPPNRSELSHTVAFPTSIRCHTKRPNSTKNWDTERLGGFPIGTPKDTTKCFS